MFEAKAQAKREGKTALAKCAKIMVNSLYGGFGLRTKARSRVELHKPRSGMWLKMLEEKRLQSVAWFPRFTLTRAFEDSADCGFVSVAVASAITSMARSLLWGLMDQIQKRGERVYYCDTDSVMYGGPRTLPLESGLGKLTNELPDGVETSEIMCFAPKFYIIVYTAPDENGDTYMIKTKGVTFTPNNSEVLSPDSLRSVLYHYLAHRESDGPEAPRAEQFMIQMDTTHGPENYRRMLAIDRSKIVRPRITKRHFPNLSQYFKNAVSVLAEGELTSVPTTPIGYLPPLPRFFKYYTDQESVTSTAELRTQLEHWHAFDSYWSFRLLLNRFMRGLSPEKLALGTSRLLSEEVVDSFTSKREKGETAVRNALLIRTHQRRLARR